MGANGHMRGAILLHLLAAPRLGLYACVPNPQLHVLPKLFAEERVPPPPASA